MILYRLVSAQIEAGAKVTGNRVLVASRNLESGALVKEADVKIAEWGGAVPQGTLARPEDAIGRGVVEPIVEGEPIMESRLAAKGAGAGLAAIIPPGMRAVAVRVNDVVGVAGFLSPGTKVDILIAGNPPNAGAQTLGTQTKTLLQDIEVLSAGQNIQKDAEGKPVSVPVVNMLVTPEQAEILSLASNETRIQLVLRNPTDKEITKTKGTAIAYLFGAPQTEAKPVPKPAPRPKKALVAAAPPPAPVPQKIDIPILVEIIHGAKKTEVTFKSEDDRNKPAPEAKP
jgi:pilus assembly protein CpaB